MESVNIADYYEEAFDEYDQECPLLMESVMQKKILPSENRPNRFFQGLIFALPIVLVTWGIFIFVLWFLL